MSLKDILGFDPAVQCYPLSLALCLVLVFLSTSYPVSLHSHVAILHFAILSSSASFSLFHFRFLILFLLLLFLTTVSVSVSRTKEGSSLGNSFAETWHRTAKHEWYIYMAPREKPGEMDLLGKGLSSVTSGERRREETRNVFFERKLANPLSKPRGSSSTVFTLIRLRWILLEPGFRAWLKNVWCEFERDLFRRSTDPGWCIHVYHKNITHGEYIQFTYINNFFISRIIILNHAWTWLKCIL